MTEADAVDSDAGDETPVAPAPEPEQRYGALVSWSHGDAVLHPSRETLVDTVTQMKADGWVSVLDLFGVDYLSATSPRDLPPGIVGERFEIVISMINHAAPSRVRLRVQVPEADPVLPSLFDLFPGTEAPEREAWDMFGISFDGHPLLTRILMPEDWQGHPLRKDYGVGNVPVQFKLKGAR